MLNGEVLTLKKGCSVKTITKFLENAQAANIQLKVENLSSNSVLTKAFQITVTTDVGCQIVSGLINGNSSIGLANNQLTFKEGCDVDTILKVVKEARQQGVEFTTTVDGDKIDVVKGVLSSLREEENAQELRNRNRSVIGQVLTSATQTGETRNIQRIYVDGVDLTGQIRGVLLSELLMGSIKIEGDTIQIGNESINNGLAVKQLTTMMNMEIVSLHALLQVARAQNDKARIDELMARKAKLEGINRINFVTDIGITLTVTKEGKEPGTFTLGRAGQSITDVLTTFSNCVKEGYKITASNRFEISNEQELLEYMLLNLGIAATDLALVLEFGLKTKKIDGKDVLIAPELYKGQKEGALEAGEVLIKAKSQEEAQTGMEQLVNHLQQMGTGLGKTFVISGALLPLVRAVNERLGKATLLFADTGANVLNLRNELLRVYGRTFGDVLYVDRSTKSETLQEAIQEGKTIVMTYGELGFRYLDDKAKVKNGAKAGEGTILMNNMGVVMSDEVDMLAFTPRSILSGGSIKDDFTGTIGKWWIESTIDIAAVAAEEWLKQAMAKDAQLATYATVREQVNNLLTLMGNGEEITFDMLLNKQVEVDGKMVSMANLIGDFILVSANVRLANGVRVLNNVTLNKLKSGLEGIDTGSISQADLRKSLAMAYVLADKLLKDRVKTMTKTSEGYRGFNDTLTELIKVKIADKQKKGWNANIYNGLMEKELKAEDMMLQAAKTLLTWTLGEEYDVSKDGEILLRCSGSLAALIPPAGTLQAIEVILGMHALKPEYIKSEVLETKGRTRSNLLFGQGGMGLVLKEAFGDAKYTDKVCSQGITRPLDGDPVMTHALDAIKNAAGVLGFSGTYSEAVRTALGFKSKGDGTPSVLKKTGVSDGNALKYTLGDAKYWVDAKLKLNKEGALVIAEKLSLGNGKVFEENTSVDEIITKAKELGIAKPKISKDGTTLSYETIAEASIESPADNLFELYRGIANGLLDNNMQGIVCFANDTDVKLFKLYLGIIRDEGGNKPFVAEMDKVTGMDYSGNSIHQAEFIEAATSAERVDAIAKSGVARLIIGNAEVLGRGLDIKAWCGLDEKGKVGFYIVAPERMYASALTQCIGRVLGKRFGIREALGVAGYYDINVHLVTDVQSLENMLPAELIEKFKGADSWTAQKLRDVLIEGRLLDETETETIKEKLAFDAGEDFVKGAAKNMDEIRVQFAENAEIVKRFSEN
ncbi:MAG: hypothetical protein FJZ16_07365, partial [Candidatus Omnitrophica bacterium]|nr:hypothetical protein [Candidatus Omnitrophota bacterium]